MKNWLLILFLMIAFSSCVSKTEKEQTLHSGVKIYTFRMVYSNGDIDTVLFNGVGDNLFVLEHGDLKLCLYTRTKTLFSGVRAYEVLNIGYTNNHDTIIKSRMLPK